MLKFFVLMMTGFMIGLTRTQNCCDLPAAIQSAGLQVCSQYLAQQGCSYPLCGSCSETNLIFSADPNCFYPC